MPSREEIEEYLAALDEWVSSTVHAATSDIPSLNAIAHRIWADLGRFGPPSISMQIPGLGLFDVPPKPIPPPPPPPVGWLEATSEWVAGNKWKALALGVGFAVGSGLLVGYVSRRMDKARVHARRKRVSESGDRKEAAVVLGADCPIGPTLVAELVARGFIVVATVTNSDMVEEIEGKGRGFVRVLILNPELPAAVSGFIKELQSTLSLRFPTSVSGDPYYASPSLYPHVSALISLLALHDSPPPTPFEHLPLASSYMEYLQLSHITPMSVIQNILPLMRVPATSHRNSNTHTHPKKKILVCLPVIASRVGVPWNAAQAMSAGASTKALDVLRRELRESGQSSNIAVSILDVGAVSGREGVDPETGVGSYNNGAATYMNDWTPSLRATYGPAFLSALEHSRVNPQRKPEDVTSVAKKIAVVLDPHTGGLSLTTLLSYLHPERVAVGAGAYTYAVASKLPECILDYLLSLPGRLIKLRDTLIPLPRVPNPDEEQDDEEEDEEEDEDADEVKVEKEEEEDLTTRLSALEETEIKASSTPGSSGYSSEIDLESINSSDKEQIGSSWVSLNTSGKAE